jgi:hypothetical protein
MRMTFLSDKNKNMLKSTKMNMSMDIWIVWKRQKDSHLAGDLLMMRLASGDLTLTVTLDNQSMI